MCAWSAAQMYRVFSLRSPLDALSANRTQVVISPITAATRSLVAPDRNDFIQTSQFRMGRADSQAQPSLVESDLVRKCLKVRKCSSGLGLNGEASDDANPRHHSSACPG